MFSRRFVREVLERAVKTAAQFALVSGVAEWTSVISADWSLVAGAAGAGFVVSVLTSLASLPLGESGSASVVSGDDVW